MDKQNKKILLKVRNINKTFKTGKNITLANNDVSFDIPHGKVVGLIGESGSGKTTIGRIIMNLHNADNGSVKLNNHEINGKKLSKSQKKYLYNNIQMIFQDPYSSLNSQKNIMSIVSESLKAKGHDKLIYKSYFDNRKDVLFYFKNELRENLLKKRYEYQLFLHQRYLVNFQKIHDILDDFQIDKTKKLFDNLKSFVDSVYEIKEEANYELVNKLDDLINVNINYWQEKQKNVRDASFSFQDEKILLLATEKFNNAKRLLQESLQTQKIKLKLKTAKENKQSIIDDYNDNLKNIRRDYRSKIKNLKSLLLDFKNMRQEAINIKNYNHYSLLVEQVQVEIKIIKEFIKIKNKMFDWNAFLEKIDQIYLDINLDKWNNDFYKGPFVDQELISTLFSAFIMDNAKYEQYQKNIQEWNLKIQKINKSLQENIRKDKLRELNDLKTKVIDYRQEAEGAKKIFLAQVRIYEQKSVKLIGELKNEIHTKILSMKPKIKNLRILAKKREKQIKRKIFAMIKINSEGFFKARKEISQAKLLYKSSRVLNKKLLTEIKVNWSLLKRIEYLYNAKNKLLFFIYRRSLKKIFIRQEVFDTLQKVGLAKSSAYRYPHEFSGGMRQRVGIARALISKPKLIIADEPIAALDLSIQAQIVNLLMHLKRQENLSLLFIAHDLSMVKYNSDYVLIMHLGRIVEYGQSKNIFSNPIHPYTKNLINSMPSFSKLNSDFVDRKFLPLYLEKYDLFNKPTYIKVDHDHYVLSTKEQIREWTSLKK